MDDEDARVVGIYLEGDDKITTLVMSGGMRISSFKIADAEMTIKGATSIGNALCKNSTLTHLDLRRAFGFSSHGSIAEIARSLFGNSALLTLLISDNVVCTHDIKEVANLIRNNFHLKFLEMSAMGIGSEDIGYIADAIEENESLEKLDLEG